MSLAAHPSDLELDDKVSLHTHVMSSILALTEFLYHDEEKMPANVSYIPHLYPIIIICLSE